MAAAIKCGIFGGGVVGGGTYELVQKVIKNGRLAQLGASVEVSKICVSGCSFYYFRLTAI